MGEVHNEPPATSESPWAPGHAGATLAVPTQGASPLPIPGGPASGIDAMGSEPTTLVNRPEPMDDAPTVVTPAGPVTLPPPPVVTPAPMSSQSSDPAETRFAGEQETVAVPREVSTKSPRYVAPSQPITPPTPMPSVPSVSSQPYVAPYAGTPAGYQYPPVPPAAVVERPQKRGAGMIVAITALAVLVVGLGAAIAVIQLTKTSSSATPAVIAPSAHRGTHATTPTSPPPSAALPLTPTSNPAAEAEAQQLSTLLSKSAQDRNEIVGAVSEITNCGNLSDAQNTLQLAETSRQSLLDQLGTMQLGALPNSAALVQALQSAWQASLQSDSSYAAYAGDELSNFNGCVSNDPNDSNAQSAAASDARATTAKTQFVGLWNPIATSYGLPQYQQSDL
jgi:hypothetical protein